MSFPIYYIGLEYIQSSIANLQFEFGCEHLIRTKQDHVSFIVIDLNSIEIDHDQMQNEQQQHNNNIFACIVYDYQQDIAQRIINFLRLALQENIYIQRRRYEEGFGNIISILKSYIYSSEAQKDFSNHLEYDFGRFSEMVVINAFMKINDSIYLSKSFSKYHPFQNRWKVKLKQSDQYQDISVELNLIDKDREFYQIKQEIASQISEICIFSNQSQLTEISLETTKKYPIREYKMNILKKNYLLKLTNI